MKEKVTAQITSLTALRNEEGASSEVVDAIDEAIETLEGIEWPEEESEAD